jgi:hypothetical protein
VEKYVTAIYFFTLDFIDPVSNPSLFVASDQILDQYLHRWFANLSDWSVILMTTQSKIGKREVFMPQNCD